MVSIYILEPQEKYQGTIFKTEKYFSLKTKNHRGLYKNMKWKSIL